MEKYHEIDITVKKKKWFQIFERRSINIVVRAYFQILSRKLQETS